MTVQNKSEKMGAENIENGDKSSAHVLRLSMLAKLVLFSHIFVGGLLLYVADGSLMSYVGPFIIIFSVLFILFTSAYLRFKQSDSDHSHAKLHQLILTDTKSKNDQ